MNGTVGEIIQQSVMNSKKRREQIADEVGVGYSLFCRMINPNDEGARFPAEHLIPLMRATGDYSPLQHIAARTGHLLVEIKKMRVPKGARDGEIRQALHETFVGAMAALNEFFKEPSPEKKAETLAAIDRLLGDGIAARRQVEKWEQPELELD